MRTNILIAGAMLILSGCAGMDEAECQSADWRTIGFEDGTSGRTQASIGKYRKECAEHGVAPDLEQYRLGYGEGVRNFCTQSSGFDYGRRGGAYQGVCPGEVESEFLEGYSLGRAHFVLSGEVSSLNSRIGSANERIRSLEDSIARKTLEVANSDTTGDRRVELLLDIKNETLEISDLKYRIREYEAELSSKEAEYASLERPDFY